MELLRIVSTHLVRNEDSSPIMLDLPPSYYLDRMISHPPSSLAGRTAAPPLSRPALCPSITAEQKVSVCSPIHPLNYSGRISHLFWNYPTLRRAIQLTSSHGHGKRSRPASVVSHSVLLVDAVKTAVPQVRPPKMRDVLRRSLSTSSVSGRAMLGVSDDETFLGAYET